MCHTYYSGGEIACTTECVLSLLQELRQREDTTERPSPQVHETLDAEQLRIILEERDALAGKTI